MAQFSQDSRVNEIISRIPALKGITGISLLEGGLTNRSYRVDTKTGSFVMRINDTQPELLGIDRENERVNSIRACEAGVAPAVKAALAEEGVLVVRWIEAQTLHAADMRGNPLMLGRIAHSLRMLHGAPAFRGDFHFTSTRRMYLRTVEENHFFIPGDYRALEPLVLDLENAMALNPEPLVPCNNDLLAENFLDDGQKIWIIDYEYSGMNEASFEIGNLASESGLSEEDLTELCNAYWQAALPAKIARARAWSMVARYGWVLWASIQEAISKKDFDFRTWGMKKWESVLPELQGDAYHTILKTLKQRHP